MKWNQVLRPWQVAIEQAWMAYCAGSLPIGAAIAAPDGRVVAEGRNRLNDVGSDGDPLHLRQHFMAHAEQNAFISLGVARREQPEVKRSLKDFVLYTTLEPCDMCVGTLIQSGLKRVEFLVPDPLGGGIESLTATAHVRDKGIAVEGPQIGALADVVLAIFMVSITQSGMTMPDDVISLLASYSAGLALGKLLVESGELEQFRIKQTPLSTVWNFLQGRHSRP
ncbi:MAG: nucleoside deaminase [Anaerolineae bacterium]|nr:nucleoside deaminase [Anaerolineae bacterium]